MILYHVITQYHLINAITFHNKYHNGENAIMILPDFIKEVLSDTQIRKLTESGFMNSVCLFPYTKLKLDTNLENEVSRVIEGLLPIDLCEFKHIYVWGFHFYFTAELIKRKIDFIVGEEAAGAFSKMEICADAIKKSKFHYEWAVSNNLLDYSNELIRKIIINESAQIDKCKNDLCFDFDVTKELVCSESEFKHKILDLFNFNDVIDENGQDKKIVFLTQHFMNLNILSYDEQVNLNRTVLDFYFENKKILIKPHPSDVMDYENIFVDDEVLRGKFPLELLPIISNTDSMHLASVYSTGVESLKEYFADTFVLDMAYRNEYTETPLVWSVLNMFIDINEMVNVCGVGLNLQGFNHLMSTFNEYKKCCSSESIENAEIIIIGNHLDDCVEEWRRIDNFDKKTLIFLDRKNELLYDLVKKGFHIYPMSVMCYGIKHKLFIVKEDEQMSNDFLGYKTEKALVHSGDVIKTEICSKDELYIAELEAKLDVTEARLNYYVELVKKLRKGEL